MIKLRYVLVLMLGLFFYTGIRISWAESEPQLPTSTLSYTYTDADASGTLTTGDTIHYNVFLDMTDIFTEVDNNYMRFTPVSCTSLVAGSVTASATGEFETPFVIVGNGASDSFVEINLENAVFGSGGPGTVTVDFDVAFGDCTAVPLIQPGVDCGVGGGGETCADSNSVTLVYVPLSVELSENSAENLGQIAPLFTFLTLLLVTLTLGLNWRNPN